MVDERIARMEEAQIDATLVGSLTQQVERLQQELGHISGHCDLARARAEQAEAEVARLRGELTRVYQLYSEAVAALGEKR